MSNLEQFAESLLNIEDTDDIPGICPTCLTAMNITGVDYQCKCGYICSNAVEETRDHGDAVSTSLRRATGTYKGRMYNSTNDYAKAQKKMIVEQLMRNRRDYNGDKIPENILQKTAEIYNGIQRNHESDEDQEKKFVRRGPIKDEILSFLIEKVCESEGLARSQQEISQFMKLRNNGYARGEKIVNSLIAAGRLALPEPVSDAVRHTDHFFEKMNITEPRYHKFVCDIFDISEQLQICMQSQPASKIVGAIYLLVRSEGLKFTAADIERFTSIKKNTFNKFYKELVANKSVFTQAFIDNGVAF